MYRISLPRFLEKTQIYTKPLYIEEEPYRLAHTAFLYLALIGQEKCN